jgi:hypothetical protein
VSASGIRSRAKPRNMPETNYFTGMDLAKRLRSVAVTINSFSAPVKNTQPILISRQVQPCSIWPQTQEKRTIFDWTIQNESQSFCSLPANASRKSANIQYRLDDGKGVPKQSKLSMRSNVGAGGSKTSRTSCVRRKASKVLFPAAQIELVARQRHHCNKLIVAPKDISLKSLAQFFNARSSTKGRSHNRDGFFLEPTRACQFFDRRRGSFQPRFESTDTRDRLSRLCFSDSSFFIGVATERHLGSSTRASRWRQHLTLRQVLLEERAMSQPQRQ